MEKLLFPLNIQLFAEGDDDEKVKGKSPENEDVDEEDEDIDDGDLGDDEEDENEDEVGDKAKKTEENQPHNETEKEKNARQAALRRKREQEEREKREKKIHDDAYLEGQLGSIKVNTFTNKPITNKHQLKVFLVQQDIEAKGGDPIADLPEVWARLEQEKEEKVTKAEKDKVDRQQHIDKDIADFKEAYPKVNPEEVFKDPLFKKYSNGKLGVIPLSDIYADFIEMKEALSPKKEKKDKEEEGNGTVKPPSSTGGRKQEATSYSKMTKEEKEAELRRQGLIR